MEKFKFDLNHGHFLVKIGDKRYLLDTGCPLSFGNGDVELNCFIHRLQPDFTIVDSVNNSDLFEGTVDGLIGMNILEKHSITLDMENCEMIVEERLTDGQYAHSIPLKVENVMGQPYVKIVLNNNRNTILDTGAWVSYANAGFIGDRPASETVKDFSPMVGDIETTLHMLDINLDGANFQLGFAKMPSNFERVLSMINVEVILGVSCLPFKKIRLDFRKGKLMLNP